MSKVGIVAYGTIPFSKEDHKIETILHKSTNNLFQKNSNIDKKEIDAVLVSTNNNSKYLSPILSEMAGIQPKIAHSIESLCNSGTNYNTYLAVYTDCDLTTEIIDIFREV